MVLSQRTVPGGSPVLRMTAGGNATVVSFQSGIGIFAADKPLRGSFGTAIRFVNAPTLVNEALDLPLVQFVTNALGDQTLDRGEVLWIGRGRKRESIDAFYHQLSDEQRAGIEGVAMDLWQPYFESTIAHVPDAGSKIVFDKFHITAYLTKAFDLTRRAMMRDKSLERTALKGTKYTW